MCVHHRNRRNTTPSLRQARFVDQVRAYPSTRRFTAPTGSPAAPRRRHREVRCLASRGRETQSSTLARGPDRGRVPPACPSPRAASPSSRTRPPQLTPWSSRAHRPGRPSSPVGPARQRHVRVIPLALWSAPIDFPRATPQPAVDGPLAGWPRGSVRGVMAVRWPDGQRTFARMCCPR